MNKLPLISLSASFNWHLRSFTANDSPSFGACIEGVPLLCFSMVPTGEKIDKKSNKLKQHCLNGNPFQNDSQLSII